MTRRTGHKPDGTFDRGHTIGVRHGSNRRSHRTKEYVAWMNMKKRCFYEKDDHYDKYGGRGITVCASWRDSFENFLRDVGHAPSPAHTLERDDVDGHYEPKNVRWALPREQSRNKRSNTFIVMNGRRLCLVDACAELGIKVSTFTARINAYGWTVERATGVPGATMEKL